MRALPLLFRQSLWSHPPWEAIAVVQSLSRVQLFATRWTAAHQASLSFTISKSLLKLMSIELMMPSNHLNLCRPFSCPQSFPAPGSFPMSRLFPSGGQSIGVSASASVLPVNSGLISFRMDWLDLLAVQGTLKSVLQHHSSRASTFQHSAFFMGQWAQALFTPAQFQPPGTPFAEHPVKCQLSQRGGEHQDLSYNSAPGTQRLPDLLPGKKAPRT